MYETNYQFKKKKGNGKLAIVLAVIGVLLLITLVAGFVVFFMQSDVKAEETNSNEINEILEEEDAGTTELIGYGEITLSKDSPYLSLSNLESNTTLLIYTVKDENEDVLYETGYLMPGDEEEFNVYEEMEAGEHVLIYDIDIYSDSFELLHSEIEMLQKINIQGESE